MLSAASMGRSVILIGSEGSASQLAQGGIAYRGSKDPEQFIADIIKAGCECNYLPTVELIVRKGPKYIEAWLLDKLIFRLTVLMRPFENRKIFKDVPES